MPTLDVSGASLYYERTGSGSPVLLIQGAGAAGSAWRPQTEELSREFHCLSFDNRGIGRSTTSAAALTIEQMAADARVLLDHAGWDSAHVVGHSMGGLIAQQLALDARDKVRSLALLCTFEKGPQAARVTPSVIWMGLRTRVGTRAMRRRGFLHMLFPGQFLASQPVNTLADRVGKLVGRDLADSPPILMKQLAAMRSYDSSSRLEQLSGIPTLVASAQHDPIARPQFGRQLSARVPGSSYIEIPDASHGVTMQLPAKINDLLRLHFRRADAARSESKRG